ncbi:MAG TPA: DUF1989 domain-containing protein [Alphaproteobacteria bacterium]
MTSAAKTASATEFANTRPDIDEIVPPGGLVVKGLPAAGRLRIVDLEGQQSVDFLCLNGKNLNDRYNAANTLKLSQSIYLSTGSVLYSDRAKPLMTVVADTVGRHDTIAGCCSREMNLLRYGVDHTPNCRDNFLKALGSLGVSDPSVPANANFFMNVPVEANGRVTIADGLSKAGDYIELRAEQDVVIIVSNCPQEHNPCAGGKPTPIQIMAWFA